MIKKLALSIFSMVLGFAGLIFFNLIYGASLAAYVPPINIFLIFPLSLFYLYACFTARGYRAVVGLIIVVAYLFMVVITEDWPDRADTIYLAQDIFGSKLDLTMSRKTLPWNAFELYKDHRGPTIMFGPLILAFALVELGGWCFRKADMRITSPKIRTALKSGPLLIINAMSLVMLAAKAGLISNRGSEWSYGFFGLIFLGIGTVALAIFIWFKPSWRWWVVMAPSILVFYWLPFWILAHMNNNGEIVG